MNNTTADNPWKGLRTYREGDAIYGRTEEIESLSLLILQNHQTVVYGRSGIGKSSLLMAGIFPLVRKKGVFPVYVRFGHKAEQSYLQQIKDAIRTAVNKSDGAIEMIELTPPSDSETLWEFFHRIEYRNTDGHLLKPMVVFDQFEEIFTLQTDSDKVNSFFSQLADLINNVMPESLIKSDSDVTTPRSEAADNGMMDLGLDMLGDSYSAYNPDSDFHLVFTLREDFLFYLERNSSYIPELKNNRYCLQPITDRQAAEIIMLPRPGLVDADVAKLIIEKVTGEKNVKLDGIPGIQVDSAILSLYLSRLYDKMIASGDSKITAQLVEAYSQNIIDDFYRDAIEGLPLSGVEWLEENLITDGRRDNHYKSTVIKQSGMSKAEVDRLIFDVKLLRQFSYSGNLRVEYVHDVLIPAILKIRQARLDQKMLRELHESTKRDKRRLLWRTIGIAALLITAIISAGIWYIKSDQRLAGTEKQQNILISLTEDDTVNDMDFWKAMLTVRGTLPSGKDSVLLQRPINKAEISTPISINIDSCTNLALDLDFGDLAERGSYINSSMNISVVKALESPFIQIPVSRNLPRLLRYNGRLLLDVADAELPLENAVVLLGDLVAVTDSMGYFSMAMQQMPDESDMILFAKGSMGSFESHALNHSDSLNIYKVLPADSLHAFRAKAQEMDSVDRWNFSTVGKAYCANASSDSGLLVKFSDGHTDRLKMYWQKGPVDNQKVALSGYFYFNNENKALDQSGNGHLAYYIGTGYIDNKTKKDDHGGSYRNFEFKGYNAAGNIRTISGKYYTTRQGSGHYSGEVFSRYSQAGTFGQ